MDNLIRESIVEVIGKNKNIVKLAVEQRAKFEGWLKFELADFLNKAPGVKEIEIEACVPGTGSKVDLLVKKKNSSFFVELKTSNTSYEIDGIASACRPMTGNINSIIEDAQKLKSANAKGVVAFVLFPIPDDDKDKWVPHFYKIASETGISLEREKHCTELDFTITGGNRCKLVVCAFKV